MLDDIAFLGNRHRENAGIVHPGEPARRAERDRESAGGEAVDCDPAVSAKAFKAYRCWARSLW